MLLHAPLIAGAWYLITLALGWDRRQPTGEGSDASKEGAATRPVLGNLRTELQHRRRIARNAAAQGHNARVSRRPSPRLAGASAHSRGNTCEGDRSRVAVRRHGW